MRFVDVFEFEVGRHVFRDLARIVQQPAERREHVMVAAVVVEFDLADQFESNALVFDLVSSLFELDVDLLIPK